MYGWIAVILVLVVFGGVAWAAVLDVSPFSDTAMRYFPDRHVAIIDRMETERTKMAGEIVSLRTDLDSEIAAKNQAKDDLRSLKIKLVDEMHVDFSFALGTCERSDNIITFGLFMRDLDLGGDGGIRGFLDLDDPDDVEILNRVHGPLVNLFVCIGDKVNTFAAEFDAEESLPPEWEQWEQWIADVRQSKDIVELIEILAQLDN